MTSSESPELALPPGAARRAPGVALTLVLAVGACFAGYASLDAPNTGSVRTGEWATDFEDHLDEHIGFRDAAITAWGIAEYGLFAQGRPGVIVGADGWLFTSEELDQPRGGEAATAQKLQLAEAVTRYLAAHHIELIVAVIPAKARVYSRELGDTRLPLAVEGRYNAFVLGLRARGVRVVGLLPALSGAPADAPTFLRTDTHWTPRGAELAAQAIAAAAPSSLPPTSWTRQVAAPVEHRGDLLRYLPLGPLQDRWGPAPDRLETPSALRGGGLGLFDDVTVPAALVGTSYSADARWGFQDALRLALRADVLDAADPGGGPVEPLLDYLENEAFRQTPPQLVIWEVPERYVPVYDDLAGHQALLAELGLGGGR